MPTENGTTIIHYKVHWHAAIKEVGYSAMDLRVKDWLSYTQFDKRPVTQGVGHTTLISSQAEQVPGSEVQYISGQDRCQRCVWKASPLDGFW